ncbi:hypothetical protein BASA81_011819 [Batrachochytrium salamandrivorans]|nr:hypothetical protein BASA81_011819 [Batrachochytrium salamandrivorans]
MQDALLSMITRTCSEIFSNTVETETKSNHDTSLELVSDPSSPVHLATLTEIICDSYHPPPTASLDDFTPDFEDYVAPPNQVSNDGASYAAGYNAGYSAGLQVAQTSGICMVPGVRHHRHRHIRHNNPNAHQASLFRFSGRPTLFHQTGHPAHLHSTRHGGPGRHV